MPPVGKKQVIVFVGLSGGVDSAVSAALLKKAGYEVVGVFMRTWHPEFLECNEEAERLDAMRVAANLDIPFLTFDFQKEYKKEVADYMISEYKAGRTPNPDVMCNQHVKFGAFLKKAVSMGADFVATGHYARTKRASGKFQVLKVYKDRKLYKLDEPYELLTGRDGAKDQSYFLWTLKQEQLKKILFPVGRLEKTEVRKLARKFSLPVAEKKDSQGICFLGAVDLKIFLEHYIKSKRGKVLDERGEEIGHHNGTFFYTLGERHGFTITKKSPNDRPYYIIGKDVKKNILYVSQDKNCFQKRLRSATARVLRNFSAEKYTDSFENNFYLALKNTNWIFEIPDEGKFYAAQIRYHGELLPCKIKCSTPSVAQVIFEKPILAAAGQSCVIYDGDICLGGGVVV